MSSKGRDQSRPFALSPPTDHEGRVRTIFDSSGWSLGVGIALGVALGAGFGLAMHDLGVGLAIGIGLGAVLGVFMSSQKKKRRGG
jgi:hypothetical protein